jgi:diadenosine tetraphosphate (Ap4A) HIT family hydrolase
MDVLPLVEQIEHALRKLMRPEKISLTSFSNPVSHLHWHVFTRYADDVNFLQLLWGQVQRAPHPASVQVRRERLGALRVDMHKRLATYV